MTYTFDENGWQMDEIVAGQPTRYRKQLHTSVIRGERNWLQLRDVTEHVALWFADQYLGEVEAGFLPRVFELRDFASGSFIAVEPLHPVRVALPTVELFNTGDVRIARYKVLCTEADPDRGTLLIGVELDALNPIEVSVQTVVRSTTDGSETVEHRQTRSLAAGRNRLRFSLTIDRPRLWSMASPNRYEVETTVTLAGSGALSDMRSSHTGFRVPGLRGKHLVVGGTTVPSPFVRLDAVEDLEQRLRTAAERRVCVEFCDVMQHGTYDLADELGVAVCQRLLESTDASRQAIDLLAHHPSILAWSAPRRPLRKWRPVPDQYVSLTERGDGTRPLLRH